MDINKDFCAYNSFPKKLDELVYNLLQHKDFFESSKILDLANETCYQLNEGRSSVYDTVKRFPLRPQWWL